MEIIKVQELEFGYDKRLILKQLSFDVEREQFITILGPNGCGKTTLLKNMCWYLKPQKGLIQLEGEQISKFSSKERARKIAVVHQQNQVEFDFTVEEVVLMGRYPHLKRFEREGDMDYHWITEVMEKTDVLHLKEKSIMEISGGERQRVVIARALVQQTNLIYLDEPISHLDIKHQIGILKLCRQLIQDRKMTVVMTLHDINLACRYSDKILLMHKGKIEAYGVPKDVLTVERIKKVYEVDVEQFVHQDGTTYIIPREE